MLSACLGECLCLAAAEESPVGEGMISVKLHEYEETFEKCKEKGFGFWCQEPGNIVDQVSSRHGPSRWGPSQLHHVCRRHGRLT